MSDKQTYQLEEQIKRYLQDQMTGHERHTFEREMQHDHFLAEAVEGYSDISAELVGADLSDLKKRINKQQKGKRKYIWYAAASVIVLVVSSLILFNSKESSKQMVSESTIQLKAAPGKEIVTKKKEFVLSEPAAIKEPLPKKNVTMPEKVMIVAERKATSHRKATNITESDSASLVSEKSKLKESIQLRGNTALAEASRTLSDTSTLAFNEVDTSKNPIQIRGVSTLNDQVMNIPGVEVKTQSANEKTDNRLVASVQEETALNEVVVVGYGTQKKVDLTGSVAGLNTNQIEDKSASPAIGWVAFNKYLKAALLTPNIGSPKVKTVVRLSFVITKTGLMEQIKVLSSKDERYNEEAIRILKAGPGWNPEVKNQSLQSSEVTFRIVFEPKDKRIVK